MELGDLSNRPLRNVKKRNRPRGRKADWSWLTNDCWPLAEPGHRPEQMDDVWAVLVASQDDSDCACHQTIHAPRFVADDVDGLVRRELLQTGSFQNGISEVRRHLAEPPFTNRQIMSRAPVH
jgi:hypothetical protein